MQHLGTQDAWPPLGVVYEMNFVLADQLDAKITDTMEDARVAIVDGNFAAAYGAARVSLHINCIDRIDVQEMVVMLGVDPIKAQLQVAEEEMLVHPINFVKAIVEHDGPGRFAAEHTRERARADLLDILRGAVVGPGPATGTGDQAE